MPGGHFSHDHKRCTKFGVVRSLAPGGHFSHDKKRSKSEIDMFLELMDLFRRGQSEEDEGTAAEEAETTAKQEADTMRPQRPSKKRRRQE